MITKCEGKICHPLKRRDITRYLLSDDVRDTGIPFFGLCNELACSRLVRAKVADVKVEQQELEVIPKSFQTEVRQSKQIIVTFPSFCR